MTNDLHQAIRVLESVARDPSNGLPDDVFLFITRMTPMVNVDLLIHDPTKGCLLTWRDDEFHEAGWHVPGGIIRFQETAAARIRKTAEIELGTEVEFQPDPIAIREGIVPQNKTRGHFISLLYRCVLLGPPAPELRYDSGVPKAGQWSWHAECPADMIEVHRNYAEFF